MNQLHVLITGVLSIAVGLAAVGIANYALAQDNATMMTGNMTGNMTGDNATMMTGNMTGIDDNTTGMISGRGGK